MWYKLMLFSLFQWSWISSKTKSSSSSSNGGRKKERKKWNMASPKASSRASVSFAAATLATVKFSVTPPLNWPMNWSAFYCNTFFFFLSSSISRQKIIFFHKGHLGTQLSENVSFLSFFQFFDNNNLLQVHTFVALDYWFCNKKINILYFLLSELKFHLNNSIYRSIHITKVKLQF